MFREPLKDQFVEADLDMSFTPAVVLLSGGQDSTTLLHYAMRRHGRRNVFALGFNYGQRHRTELDQAGRIAAKYDVPYTVLDMHALSQVGTSALTGAGDVSAPHKALDNVPASFVPARNAIFLTMAFSYAQYLKAGYVYGGMCQTDYSGYPDCRESFVRQLNRTLVDGYQPETTNPVIIDTPLMHITKGETFLLAEYVGALDDVVEMSHTCYEGDRTTRHAWGYGCGECPACKLRAAGWAEYLELKGQAA